MNNIINSLKLFTLTLTRNLMNPNNEPGEIPGHKVCVWSLKYLQIMMACV